VRSCCDIKVRKNEEREREKSALFMPMKYSWKLN